MRRNFSQADLAFQTRVKAFVDANWPAESSASVATPAVRLARWNEALREAAWTAPNLPAAFGGAGWSETQRFIWAQTCTRGGAPVLPSIGVATVASLLIANRDRNGGDVCDRYLPAILNLSVRWSVAGDAFTDEADNLEQGLVATRADKEGHAHLVGRVPWACEGLAADFLLCIAQDVDDADQRSWFIVDLTTSGVKRFTAPTWDGAEDFARIEMHEVAGTFVGRCDEQQASQRSLLGAREPGITALGAHSGIAVTQLQAISTMFDATFDGPPGEGGNPDSDDTDLRMQMADLGVQIEALQALELRFVDALERGERAPFPELVLAQRGRDLLFALGDLQTVCFGYYALPFPDETLLHNEGPIGPNGANAGMRATFGRQISALYENSLAGSDNLAGFKDQIARQLEARVEGAP